jgi:ELWxxDGT repeat protein
MTMKVSTPNFAVLNNKVFFAADGTNTLPINDQLWQTDGTASGTTLVKTINPSGAAHIFNLFSYGGKIYFGADDGVNTGQLWVSDGTSAGTMLLKIIYPGGYAFPNYFIAYNGKVYFSAIDGTSGTQLWVTDGTPSGTLKLTNINAAPSYGAYPSTFTLFNSKLFFMGVDTGAYYQLWSTDGTTAGTVKVKTDYTPRSGYAGFMPTSMAVHNGKLYMAGYDSLTATIQLWGSDGTTAGTTKVTSFPHSLYPAKLFSFENRLIFTGGDTISGEEELFASDGTAAGTVCPTPPDTWGQYPFYPWEPFNNALYYKAAYSYFADYQLCRYSEFPFGIAQQSMMNLSVYPNPTSGTFTVVLPKPTGNTTIEVYNSTGVLIRTQAAVKNVNTVDLTGRNAGLYILKVVSNGQTVGSQKVMKQ